MMRFLFSFLLLVSALQTSWTQLTTPVTWSFNIEEAGDYHIISATAEIQEPWVVYSHYTDEGGPVGTSLTIDDSVMGSVTEGALEEEGDLIKEFSSLFDLDVAKFKKEVSFMQKVKLPTTANEVSGFIRFMTCDGKRCLPPTNVNFRLEVK